MNQDRRASGPSWYEEGDGVVSPGHIGVKLNARDVIICYDDDFYPKLLDTFAGGQPSDAPDFNGSHEGMIIDGVAIFRAYPGAPASGMLMEEAIAAGAERFLMLGLAGSISPRVRMGDLVLPTWAVREEGLSYHYLDPGIIPKPSGGILSRVKEALGETSYHEGGVWTTDAVFREVPSKLRRLAKVGVLAVEMECSALMAIAIFRDVEFAALLTVTDEVFGQEWREGFGDDIVMDAWLRACRAAKTVFD